VVPNPTSDKKQSIPALIMTKTPYLISLAEEFNQSKHLKEINCTLYIPRDSRAAESKFLFGKEKKTLTLSSIHSTFLG
jgi:hypothetical protein